MIEPNYFVECDNSSSYVDTHLKSRINKANSQKVNTNHICRDLSLVNNSIL